MIPTIEEEYIIRLKETAPRIEFNLKQIQSREAGEFYVKRLQQLATQAKEKVLTLETKQEVVANGQ